MNLGLKRLGVGAKLVTGFGVVLGLMLLMSAVVLIEMASISRAVDVTVAQGIQHLVLADNLMNSNKDIAIAVRDVVSLESVSAQKESTKTLRASQKRFREELKQALETAQGDELAQLKTADSRFKAIEPMIEQVLTLVDESSFDEAKLFVFTKLRPKQAELSDGMHAYLQAQVEDAKAGAKTAREGVVSARTKLLVIVLISLLAGITIALRITRGIVGPLQDASALAASVASGNLTERVVAKGQDEISTLMSSLNAMSATLGATVNAIRVDANATAESAGQLADGTHTASQLAEEQAQQVMAVASAMEEMNESIRGVSGSAEGVNVASKKAAALSVDGSTSMSRNLNEMQIIVTQVDDSSRIIVELSEAIAQVSAVTDVIREISEQTNLLALNAAIEAARAGETGRGFAVVADEVRKLAERTGQSTAQISATLAHITAKASETVAAMQKVKETVEIGSKESREVEAKLRLIVDAITEVSTLAAEIDAATSEQSLAAEGTARSIESISLAFEGTNKTIQQAGTTAAEMHRLAQRLQQAVEKFRINA